jgi:threonine dehydrogenase-like Zn-dependent dehydrogenase
VLEALDRMTIIGRTVAVIGLGPIGLLFAHAAKAGGASHVVGIDPVSRAAVAGAFGIDDLFTSPSRTWSRDLADELRPNVIIEAVGHQVTTLDDAIRGIAANGEILCFGIPDDEYYPLNMERLLRKNLTLHAGVTRDRRQALSRAHRYLMQHQVIIAHLISHRFERDFAQEAYSTAVTTGSNRLKVVLSLAD